MLDISIVYSGTVYNNEGILLNGLLSGDKGEQYFFFS